MLVHQFSPGWLTWVKIRKMSLAAKTECLQNYCMEEWKATIWGKSEDTQHSVSDHCSGLLPSVNLKHVFESSTVATPYDFSLKKPGKSFYNHP